jgi:DNA-binding transcriptional LysR family regulator
MLLDLRSIRHAVALAEHGSFSRAADSLGIGQPTLSRSIRDLESQVGKSLFSRSRRGVKPTDFGYLFLKQAALVAAQMKDLEREVALAKGLHKGELAVGFGPYAFNLLLPLALPRFMTTQPEVRLRVQVDSMEELGQGLRKRALDLVVGERSILEADEALEIFDSLPPLKGYLFARAEHPLANRRVELGEALRYPLVQISRLPPRVLKPFLEARRRAATFDDRPVPAVECPTVEAGIAAIVGSDAVMFATLGVMKKELVARRVVALLREEWMSTNWSFTRLRNRSPNPAIEAFLTLLRAAHQHRIKEDAALERRWVVTEAGEASAAKRAAGQGR